MDNIDSNQLDNNNDSNDEHIIEESYILYQLLIHTSTHSQDEVILNRNVFPHIDPGDYIQIIDPDRPNDRLILRAPYKQNAVGRLEISLAKSIAEPLNFKAFTRVVVEKIDIEEAKVDFVELAFRRQFLSRGNMWRFKQATFGCPFYEGQNIALDGIQAQIQELGNNGSRKLSGIITNKTHFTFRSRSARIIWLLQVSAEMWEYDRNGDLYFEKFLNKFVDPLFDRWKALGVSHSLTVIFFARTLFMDNNNNNTNTNNTTKYQDHFKIVIENAAEIDKTSQLKALKKEFWAFPKSIGWNVPGNDSSNIIAVPSDAPSGNCLEALNTTLNLLDKHYMDRDLQRTGNSIVMISAGTGVFKIKPSMALITKQRMMDSGIGLDFVSLSQPPLHAVPLFEVDSSDMEGFDENSRSGLHFYETPHWINVSYLDYEKDPSATVLKPTIEQKVVTLDLPQRNFNWSGLHDYRMADFSSQSSNDKGKAFMPLPFTSTIEGYVRLGMNGGRDLNQAAHSCLLPAILNSLIRGEYKTYDDDIDTNNENINKKIQTNLQWGGISFQSLKKYQRNTYTNWQLSVSTFYNDEIKGKDKLSKAGSEVVSSSSDQWYKSSNSSSLNHSDTNSATRFSAMKRFVQSGTLLKEKEDMALSNNSNCITPPQIHDVAGSRESDNSYSEKVISLLGSNSRVRRSRNTTRNSTNALDPIFQLAFGNVNSSLSASGSSKVLMENFDNNVFNIMKSTRCNSRRNKGSPLRRSKLNNSSLMLAGSLPDKASWTEESTLRHITPPIPYKYPVEEYNDYSNNSSFDERSINQVLKSPNKGTINPHRNRSLRSDSADEDNINTKSESSTSLLGNYLNNQSKRVNRSSNILSSIPLLPRSKPSENNNNINQKVKILDEDQRYIAKNRVNPFLKEEGVLFLKYRTHNRSRWSHVFPSIKHESEIRIAHYGLNWKSLSQPAILPLTTDYLASVNTLKEEYHIQGDYELIIDSNTCAFDTAKSLLTEMICQRLSQEYQLVDLEGKDDPFSAYKNYIVTNYNESSFSKKKQISKTESDEDTDLFYILTMGHRIQFLFYNPSLRKVRVIRLLWAGPKTKVKDLHSPNPNLNQMDITNQTAEYSYLLWVPQLNKYQNMKQKFNQFPSPEYGWSNADEILLGNSDLDMNNDTVKAKRLRFTLLPEFTDTEDEMEQYYGKIDKLMKHLSKYKQSNDIMVEVIKDRTLGKSAKTKDRKYESEHHVIKIWLQGPHHCNPKWCFLKYDKNLSISRAFHIELHWLSCDSWLMDEYVNILFRRCSSWSLRIAQIPEFFCTANLDVHPFRAQPFINVPCAYSSYYVNSTDNNSWLSIVTLIEVLYFREKAQGWIEDEERYTNWETVKDDGEINENTTKKEVASNIKKQDTLKDMIVDRNKDRNNKNLSWLFSRGKSQKREKNNQYVHRLGFACVRVSRSGFVWLLNSAGRVSDISSTKEIPKKIKDINDEKDEKVSDAIDDEINSQPMTVIATTTTINRNTALRKFQELRSFCESVAISYGIFIDIVEELMITSENSRSYCI